MRKFPFPRIHGPDYDLCIRSIAACHCFENILDKSSYCAKSMAIKPLNGTFNDTYVTGVYYPNKYEVIVYNYTHITQYYN